MGRIFVRLLLLDLAWSVFAFGGVYPWVYWPAAILAAGLGLWGIAATHAWHDRYCRRALICLGLVAVTLACQIVPLPRAWFLRLTPAADTVLTQVDIQYLLHPPAEHALSLAPGDTAIVLAVFLALGLLLVGALAVFGRWDAEWFVQRLVPLGGLLAAVGVIQRALMVTAAKDDPVLIYGFWTLKQGGHIFGPFINRNHFAGWMVMALPLVIAHACSVAEVSGPPRRGGWRRFVHWTTTTEANRSIALGGAIVAMGTSLVFTGSRSGMGSFIVAVAVLAYFVMRRLAAGGARRLLLGYLGVMVAAAVAWSGIGGVIDRFAATGGDLQFRIFAWRDTLHIIRDFPLWGVGFGGFLTAMLSYQSFARTMFFADAHNDYLQIAAEGGVLVGVPAVLCLVALVLGIRGRVRRLRDDRASYWVRAGAIAGLTGIAAQSLFDFSLQIPANTLLFVVLIALALHRPAGAESRRGATR
jgi:O-antigen ligase